MVVIFVFVDHNSVAQAASTRRNDASRAIPVQTAAATTATVDRNGDALGTVTALNTVTVRSRVEGPLVAVPFHEGHGGASPEVTTSWITAPLERQFGQMPGLSQMSSASSGGASVITRQFSLDLSLDAAEQEVKAAINVASSFLPVALPMPPVYSKVNPADTPIVTCAVSSPTLPLAQVEALFDTRAAPKTV